MMHVFYRLSDGRIDGYDSSLYPETRSGCGMLEVDVIYDANRKMVDLVSLQIRDKTSAEITADNAPTKLEVQCAVFVNLQATDKYMLPDFPVTEAQLALWKTYRGQLRDLSKGDPRPTAAEMIASWPLDPDGNDAIENLRNRNQ